ncbi:HPt (histidine-containing phosphotransfer) domain-containing protein [Arthrobacter sp. SORGH_AS 212]|uniref:Hpt domain-containing protein n=1 Tax=Pseudarthrobacter sp. SORGH_AS 212 TaxID=3041777 RepID=UPI002784360C|nr:HPt (histidine-containing phosphotransfer) domain-containing protein [Arthrobacter sp. SORGH_AS_0212]
MTPTQSPSPGLQAPMEQKVPAYVAGARPPVDHSVLDRLEEELEDDAGYTPVFVANFIQGLPKRVERLRVALVSGDLAGSFDAVLSLKTSSQMVGAEQLASLAQQLEAGLRRDAATADSAVALPQLAAAFLAAITRCSGETARSLTSRQADPLQR